MKSNKEHTRKSSPRRRIVYSLLHNYLTRISLTPSSAQSLRKNGMLRANSLRVRGGIGRMSAHRLFPWPSYLSAEGADLIFKSRTTPEQTRTGLYLHRSRRQRAQDPKMSLKRKVEVPASFTGVRVRRQPPPELTTPTIQPFWIAH